MGRGEITRAGVHGDHFGREKSVGLDTMEGHVGMELLALLEGVSAC